MDEPVFRDVLYRTLYKRLRVSLAAWSRTLQRGRTTAPEKGQFFMTTEYLRYTCRTCGSNSYTRAANAQTTQEGQRLLRCTAGHQHVYDAEETESLQLEASRGSRT